MRKIVIAFAALAAFGLALPASSPAKAEEGEIVIRTGDRDRDGDHDRRWNRHHHNDKVVIIKRHRYRDHD